MQWEVKVAVILTVGVDWKDFQNSAQESILGLSLKAHLDYYIEIYSKPHYELISLMGHLRKFHNKSPEESSPTRAHFNEIFVYSVVSLFPQPTDITDEKKLKATNALERFRISLTNLVINSVMKNKLKIICGQGKWQDRDWSCNNPTIISHVNHLLVWVAIWTST